MFETSPSTEKLDAALAKAQAEISAAAKDKLNPAFRSKYADLASVWEACRAALTKHGIAVTQWPIHSDDGRLHIVTRLAHAGEWLRAEFSIPVGKQDAHGYGSATTYAKRFALSAAVGVVADDDDDGNAAANKGHGDEKRSAPPTAASKTAAPPVAKGSAPARRCPNGYHEPQCPGDTLACKKPGDGPRVLSEAESAVFGPPSRDPGADDEGPDDILARIRACATEAQVIALKPMIKSDPGLTAAAKVRIREIREAGANGEARQ